MTMPLETNPHIFISHSRKDNAFGAKLAQDLHRELGDDSAAWYDASGGLVAGDLWWDKIVREITTRSIFILILSPDAIESEWVRKEYNLALNEKKRIIPVLYHECQMWPDLRLYQYVSFLPPQTYETAFKELLITLGHPIQREKKEAKPSQLPAIIS